MRARRSGRLVSAASTRPLIVAVPGVSAGRASRGGVCATASAQASANAAMTSQSARMWIALPAGVADGWLEQVEVLLVLQARVVHYAVADLALEHAPGG